MKKFLTTTIASIAILGLTSLLASPAMAGAIYDPNDPFFDPSNTYVPPVPPPTLSPDLPEDNSTGNNVSTESDTGGESNDANQNVEEDSALKQNEIQDNGSESSTSATNENTGADSDNSAAVSGDSANTTVVNNEAQVQNDVDAGSNSGNNTASENTGDGDITTGDSDIVANIVNAANTVVQGVNSLAMPIINHFADLVGDLIFDANSEEEVENGLNLLQIVSNFLTGNNSTNDSTVSTQNSDSSQINNSAGAQNNINLSSNSGNNEASSNTGNGGIETGDANIAANVINLLNNSIYASNMWLGMINIFGDWLGNLILPNLVNPNESSMQTDLSATNQETGSNSSNNASIQNNNSGALNINNEAALIDDVAVNASTGENQSAYNTGSGQIKSGDVNIKDNEFTFANNTVIGDSWWMMIINSLKGWTGALIGSPDGTIQFIPIDENSSAINSQTGADSSNNASIDNNNQNLTDINNQAEAQNNLVLNANTGGNKTNYNTKNGTIDTGDANVISNLINFVNNTFQVKNWMVGIVNVFGNWVGDAKMNNTAIGLNVKNTKTGANSENTSSVTDNINSEISIDNNLSVDKSLTVDANTGKNDASFNTQNSTIQSGDIDFSGEVNVIGNGLYLPENFLPISGDETLSAENSTTGSDSDNNAFVKMLRGFKLFVTNSVCMVKDVVANLNTGDNTADKNTGNAEIVTGNIKFSFKEFEKLNFIETIKKGEKPVEPPVVPPVVPENGGEIIPEEVGGGEPLEVLGDLISVDLGETLPSAGAGGVSGVLLTGFVASLAWFIRTKRK